MYGLALAAVLSFPPTVWIVDDDGGPGVHFTDVQGAVDAATNGDIVLVRSGTYDELVIVQSKSITILGEGPTRPEILLLWVATVADPVALRGLDVDHLAVIDGSQAWIEDVWVVAGSVEIASAEATFVRCFMSGDTTSGPSKIGTPGLDVWGGGAIHVWDSSSYPGFNPAGADVPGIDVSASSFAFVSGGHVGASGGAENIEIGQATTLYHRDVDAPNQNSGVALPGNARHLSANSPVRDDETLVLDFEGDPNDVAFLLFSLTQSPLFNLSCAGTIHPFVGSLVIVPMGVVPASGKLQVSLPMNPLPLGFQALNLYVQANFVPVANGTCNVSSGSCVTILSSAL